MRVGTSVIGHMLIVNRTHLVTCLTELVPFSSSFFLFLFSFAIFPAAFSLVTRQAVIAPNYLSNPTPFLLGRKKAALRWAEMGLRWAEMAIG